MSPAVIKRYIVVIKYMARSGWRKTQGLGWMNYNRIQLNLPHDPQKLCIKRYGQVLIHEVDHNKGLNHKDMVGSTTLEVPWVEGLEIKYNHPKPKVKRDVQVERSAHAWKKYNEWLRKEKFAANKRRHWWSKVRYYDSVMEQRKKAADKENKPKTQEGR